MTFLCIVAGGSGRKPILVKRGVVTEMRGLTGLPRPPIVLPIGKIELKRFRDPEGEVVLGLP